MTDSPDASRTSIADAGGEFALIARFRARAGIASGPIMLGIGDDAALLSPTGTSNQTIVTTDLLIEEVHFRRSWCDPYLLGRKAVNVNLSDIAAMGGKPTATFVALALPPDLPLQWADALFEGMCDTCNEHGSHIAGGDTNASPGKIVLSITQMGRVAMGKAVLRSGARVGDVVLVTGALGAAAAGLALLESLGLKEAEEVSAEAVRAQLTPEPRLAEGVTLAGQATAMMDLSDGLLADLEKLCVASGVGATIYPSAVPIAPATGPAATRLERDPLAWALGGGEDYELLFTVPEDKAEFVRQTLLTDTKTTATVVGRIVAEPGVFLQGTDGNRQRSSVRAGWDHFAGGAR